MEEMNENLGTEKEARSNDEQSETEEPDGDVDIYGDLESQCRSSDAPNSDVIERFYKLLTPKKYHSFTEFDQDEEEPLEQSDGNDLEDDDLYGDLNMFEKHLAAEELEAKVELLEAKCTTLSQQNNELKSELEKVNRKNLLLRRNISSIFKTARTELERKDRQMKELQREHDSLIFRRGGTKVVPAAAVSHQKPPADIPDFQILKKDSANGNLVTIENQTECTFRMANVSVSFACENGDFSKQRLRRLEEKVAASESQILTEPTACTEQLLTSQKNLEEGEVAEETVVPLNHHSSSNRDSRRSNNGGNDDSRENSRRRSRSRSRSPSSKNKRKRTSSGDQRRSLRNQNQSAERGREGQRSSRPPNRPTSNESSRYRGRSYQEQRPRFNRR